MMRLLWIMKVLLNHNGSKLIRPFVVVFVDVVVRRAERNSLLFFRSAIGCDWMASWTVSVFRASLCARMFVVDVASGCVWAE